MLATLDERAEEGSLLMEESELVDQRSRRHAGLHRAVCRLGLPAALGLGTAFGLLCAARRGFLQASTPVGMTKSDHASSPERLFDNTDELLRSMAPTARLSAPPMPPGLQTKLGECPAAKVDAQPDPIFGVSQPSEGCTAMSGLCEKVDKPVMESIEVYDAQLGLNVVRHYAILVPESACNHSPGQSAPLMFWLHGQTGDAIGEADGWAASSGYRSCSYAHGWISVYPMGLGLADDAQALGVELPSKRANESNLDEDTGNDDPPVIDLGTGWNVGSGGDSNTCLTKDDKARGAFRFVKPTEYSCYPSCQAKGECGRCNWSTCMDDVAFIKTLLKHLQKKYCIDRSRIYLGGQSNGGMLTHHLSQVMPGVFASLNPIYALPLLGYAAGKHGEIFRHQDLNKETAIIAFHDRGDITIPLHGGPAPAEGWSWYYTPLEEMMSIWASVHGCDEKSSDATEMIKSACPTVAPTVSCREHLNCGSGRRVLYCVYDGVHGTVPRNEFFGCVSVWFSSQFRRTSLVSDL
mmetsp:Transcript_59966/g.126961  ORF Transcript_59966/g.126961 Transcript_59966/m.126961 type:complete len:521 (-) Transcript_59966:41-1603(-)